VKNRIAVAVGLLLSLFAVCSNAQTITWTKVWSTPGGGSPNTYYNGYHDIHYSPFIGKVIVRSTSTAGGAESIYSSRLHFFDPITFTDQLISDNGQASCCTCLPSTILIPYSAHPMGQIFVDNVRQRVWMMEGICRNFIPPEQWYYQLDNPISGHTDWTQTHPAHLPTKLVSGVLNGLFMNAGIVHDTDHDAFILFGYDGNANLHDMQVYCDTSLNGGILTPAQISVGCANADDWTDITSQVTLNGPVPYNYYYANLEYDPVHQQIIHFAGLHGCCTVENQTWTYDVLAKKWTNRNPANPPANSSANNENGRVAHAYSLADGKYYYHLTAHTPSTIGTAPSRPPEDWVYDAGANTWTHLATGNGPFLSETMTYVPLPCNCLMAWAAKVNSDGKYYATGIAEMWVGKIQ
jgi:hypothetical protein